MDIYYNRQDGMTERRKKMEEKKMVKTTIRVEKEIFKEYKKWLIDNGYNSINQHLNEVIKSIVERNKNEGHSNKRSDQ